MLIQAALCPKLDYSSLNPPKDLFTRKRGGQICKKTKVLRRSTDKVAPKNLQTQESLLRGSFATYRHAEIIWLP
ncbi:MAG: hypothetical protein DWH70_09415 [Planctomycetota bacterium]|nr:MAG: hypothetical protein DWH70_09415 [Planctomycetota bacterium]